MSHGKQFTLYSCTLGPNGWKIPFLLEALGLPYETVYLNIMQGENKEPAFLGINPNGRIPAIVDHHNNDFILWESCAILLYIVDRYDTEGKFKYSDPNDQYRVLQWLFFQASGQGPYYGQAVHFLMMHPVKVPTALKRYQDEIRRVTGVLETALSKSQWLVGDKFGIADMAMFPWQALATRGVFAEGDFDMAKEAPHVHDWMQRMLEQQPVKKAWSKREEFVKAVSNGPDWQKAHESFAALSKA
ncbi:glutathione S-transferase [Heliocybe sulcata]|uniref:Glutathione S-transferase n=1 Tax=Heliocybe sulcata TaxID=5364 RepID=A0A5C3MXQ1_9AGAM|nr:glutathione S-transferase [Heliocybe sulcata]